jgi:NADH-quinone oxidoreductase subunit J
MQTLLTQLIFYVFSAVLLISSIMVTLTQRSVHAVLWLILAFVATAGLWILIEAEFLGLILVIVYVGAVMTLFLFVVMMLNVGEENTAKRQSSGWLGFGAIFLVMAAILILLCVVPHHMNVVSPASASQNNLTQFGLALFGQDALTVELAAAILLVAIVGAIYLTHRTHTHRKKQNIAQQHSATKKNRLKIIKQL